MENEITVTLEPCPWCGTADHLTLSKCGSLTGDMPDRPYKVLCTHIDHDTIEGPVAFGRGAAITAWNTRTQPEAKAVEGDVVEKLQMARGLIEEAKGYEGEKGGPITDHLDAADSEILDVEERIAAIVECAVAHGQIILKADTAKDMLAAAHRLSTQPEAKAVEGDVVRRVAAAIYAEKIAALGVKAERFSFDRAPQQEQIDYENKARAALTRSQDSEAVGWQPIETFRGGMQRVLAWVPPYGPTTAHFDEGRWHCHSVLNREAQPTHWQPLPAAPASNEGEGA